MSKIIILILCRMVTLKMYQIYHRIFNRYDFELIFISDYSGYFERKNIFYISDDEMQQQKFNNMTTFKTYSSWDKAMFYLSNRFFDYFWIIEDDVFINMDFPEKLIEINQENNEDLLTFSWIKTYLNKNNYVHWSKGKEYFFINELGASLNVICRISSELLDKILEFNIENESLMFHEILLISICNRYQLSHTNIRRNDFILYSSPSYQLEKKELLDFLENNNKLVYHPFKNWFNYLL